MIKALLVSITAPSQKEVKKLSLATGVLKAYALKDPALREKCKIDIKNYRSFETTEYIVKNVLSFEPDIIGLSAYIWNIQQIINITKTIKNLRPNIQIIVGGPEVSFSSDIPLWVMKHIDIIVRGEGEQTFTELLRHYVGIDVVPFKEIKGISYRQGKEIINTPDRSLIEDLDEIPSPYLTGIYRLNSDKEIRISWESSRGCPMHCKFCTWGPKKVRYYSLSRVKQELSVLLQNERITFIHVNDANIFANKKRAKSILKYIIKNNKNKIKMLFDLDLLYIDEEIVELLFELNQTGCRPRLIFGLQSVDPMVHKISQRNFDLALFSNQIKALKSRIPNFEFEIDVMYGLPGDHIEAYRNTLDYTLSLNPKWINISPFVALVGSHFYNTKKEYGIKVNGNVFSGEVIETATFPKADMKKAKKISFFIRVLFSLPVFKNYLISLGEKITRTLPDFRRPYLSLAEEFFTLLEKKFDLTFGTDYPDTISSSPLSHKHKAFVFNQLHDDNIQFIIIWNFVRFLISSCNKYNIENMDYDEIYNILFNLKPSKKVIVH